MVGCNGTGGGVRGHLKVFLKKYNNNNNNNNNMNNKIYKII